jgi:membrane protein YdbS with pleckstrin-like domain
VAVNIGFSGIGLLLIVVITVVSWGVARLAGWPPLSVAVIAFAIIVVLAVFQMWRARVWRRQLMREGRWPPDRPPGAA